MSDAQDLEIEMRRALEKKDGSTWTAAIELHNAGWRKLMPVPQGPSASNVDAMRGVVKALGPCDTTDVVWALHVAGWRRVPVDAGPPPLHRTPAERAAATIEDLAQCLKEDASLRLLGEDDKELRGLTLWEERRRTTKF